MTPLAVHEPDPRIIAAEDALLRFNRDDAWLMQFDATYRAAVEDLTQTPIGNYRGVAVQTGVGDPTGRQGTALASLSVDATGERLRRVLAVRAAMDAMQRHEEQRRWAMALDYLYLRGCLLYRVAESMGTSEDSVRRYRQFGLEIVAQMLEDERALR